MSTPNPSPMADNILRSQRPLDKLFWYILGAIIVAALVGAGSILWTVEPRLAVLERAEMDNQTFQRRALDYFDMFNRRLENIQSRLPPPMNK